jgi:hypothetical protein
MKKRQLTILFLLICLAGYTTAENFYESYPESERLIIADAYLAVSEQYKEIGKAEKAASFRAIALEAYPEIEAAREAGKLSAAPEERVQADQTPASVPVRPSGTESSAVRYYFSKLMRGVFSENLPTVMSLISTRLYLPGFDQGISREEVEKSLGKAFDAFPLESTDPTAIYDFNRYFVRKEGTSWTVKVNLTPEGSRMLEEILAFPGESHIFYFREYREGWRFIALSSE